MSTVITFDDNDDFFDDIFELNDTNYNLTTLVLDPRTYTCGSTAVDAVATVAVFAVLICIFLLAIPGNVIVALVIGSNRRSLTPSDMYLFHLTVADGLLALTLPFWATAALKSWVFGDFLCKFLSIVLEANFYTSILFLVCISIDRYLVIVHAAEIGNARHWLCSRAACALVWVVGCTLALPALFNEAFKSGNSNKFVCAEQFDLGDATSWRLATRWLRHILGFFVPLVIMVTCYGITIARLLHTRGFHKHRAMRVIVAVVIAFLLCWTPFHLAVIADTLLRTKVVRFTCATRNSVDLALFISHSLALFHSCINPVLYAFVGEKFRKKLKVFIQRTRRVESVSAAPRFSRSTSQTSDGKGAIF